MIDEFGNEKDDDTETDLSPLLDDADEVDTDEDETELDADGLPKKKIKKMDDPDTESLDDLADEEEEDDLDEFELEEEGNFEV